MKPFRPNRLQGLTEAEAAESRRLHGENILTPPKDDSVWELFVDKFRDPIIRILLAAAALSLGISFVDGQFTETIGILAAIVLATCVGFLFEWDAMRRFRRLNKVDDESPVKVFRDGAVRQIPRREVVVGDCVCIESGDTIPADGTLAEALSLRVDESTLTGEAETEKSADPAAADPEATYPSACVLRGTTVLEGYGTFLVTAVGDATEAGRVCEQATVESGEQTPLHRQLTRLSQQIGKAGITLAATIFLLLVVKAFWTGGLLGAGWLTASRKLLEVFMVSVAVIVMAVPEGLPMSITLSLAMSMRRMLRSNNLVRKMHACETMGAVTVICTDKTGTLTRNRMRVEEVFPLSETDSEGLNRAIALNTTAHLDAAGAPVGSPTEGALLAWLHGRGTDYNALRGACDILDRITFSTHLKYMATLFRTPSGERVITVKGAPEILRAMCPDDPAAAPPFERLAVCQQRAMRTLALAWGVTEATTCEEALAAGDLRIGAVAAISDPVRDEVPEAVRQCLGAGIAVKIVTGDTAATATEIARRIGLWNDAADDAAGCLTGPEFARLSDEALSERLTGLKILARARPADKQRLVQLLQRRGEVVAVTGDGTNDAPALNFAHVGLAMGSGTAVAKEAGDITLLDDSFSSIVTAVLWGRSLYRNIQRFVLFQLTINFAAVTALLVGSLFGRELPLTVVQILWVNLIMDTFAAMAMASLPPDPAVLGEPPRPRGESIVTRAMACTIAACGSAIVVPLLVMWVTWLGTEGGPTPEHLTLFFTTFVFLQFWNLFNAKGFATNRSAFSGWRGCRTFLFVLALVGLGQVAIVTWGGEIFRTVPLSGRQWAAVVASTSLIALGGEAVRAFGRCRSRRR